MIVGARKVEFCAETGSYAIEVELAEQPDLARFASMLEDHGYRSLRLGSDCLLGRQDERLIHAYLNGIVLVNRCAHENEAIELATEIFFKETDA